MLKKSNLFKCVVALVTIAVMLSGCIKDELPNAEADITEVKIEGIELLRDPQITNNTIVMQADAWEDKTAVTPHFVLTEGATVTPESGTPQDFTNPVIYKVTSQDGLWTKEYKVSIVSSQEVSESYSFEHVKLQDNKFHYFVGSDASDATQQWSSPNLGYAIMAGDAPAEAYPVSQYVQGFSNKCAKLTTLSTGALGAMFGMPLASGSLFLGQIDTDNLLANPLKSTRFGIPVDKKPLAITGYYQYKSGDVFTDKENKVIEGKKDIFDIYAVFYEVTDEVQFLDGTNSLTHENIALMARIKEPKETGEWTRFELEFEPQNGKTIDSEKLANKGYNFAIVLSSSKEGGKFMGAAGSTLLVDEIKVFFE